MLQRPGARAQTPCTRCFITYFHQSTITLVFLLLFRTACAAQGDFPLPPTMPFAADFNKYPGLLAELGRFAEKVQHNVQLPPDRSQSRLLPLLPESTLVYAAIPNYGDAAHQLLDVLRWELEHSSVAADWWQHGQIAKTAPKIEDSLERFYQLSQYLGDEIVISAEGKGSEPKVLAIAEVRKPGLTKFLQQTMKDLGGQGRPPLRILDPQELAATAAGNAAGEPVLLVRSDYVVVAPSLAALREFNARLDQNTRGFASTPFGQRMAQAYEAGATTLAGADLQQIMRQSPSSPQQNQEFQRTGFADLKYLVWQHKNVAGHTVSEWELSFTNPRRGMAAWLAAPRPLGSLDFVNSKAIMSATVVLNNPRQIFEEIEQLSSASNPNAFAGLHQLEHALNFSLKDDLLSYLGGEITLELDDVSAAAPAWKALLRVSDPTRLQQTLKLLLPVAHLMPIQHDQNGTAYYTLQIPNPKAAMEIGYAFVENYLIITSSPETLTEAIELHGTVDSLGKSEKFLASLPPNHPEGASVLLYEDAVAVTALQLRRFAPQMMGDLSGQSAPVAFAAYGDKAAIRGGSSNTGFDAGALLVAAAIALPNLLRAKIAANEASAVGSLRTVNTAQIVYATTYPERRFAPDLATLGPDPRKENATSAEHANLLDATLGDSSCTAGAWCTKAGFRFSLAAASCKQVRCTQFVVLATPLSSSTGARSFCSTSDGVIRFKPGEPLTSMLTVAECQAWTPIN